MNSEITSERESEPAKPGSQKRVVRCVAWIAVWWGIIGGWSILGKWWPDCNTLSKDQVTILVAFAILICKK